MKQTIRRYATGLAFLIIMLPWTTLAAEPQCSGCKRKITGQYVKAGDGKTYCNRSCFEKTLPKCAACKKRIKSAHYKHPKGSFCSEKCLSTVMPKCELCKTAMREWCSILDHKFCHTCKKRPRCGECLLPVAKSRVYKDGRHVCADCEGFIVQDAKNVKAYYLRSREELRKITGIKVEKIPEFKLTGRDKILGMVKEQLHYNPNGVIRGFYRRTETVAESNPSEVLAVDKSIYMLYGMKANNYVVTAVHEHTHDMIAEAFPKLKKAPSWVHEGLCQYTASVVAHRFKLKKYYEAIEQHPDAVYGDGFRYFKRTFGTDNWPKVLEWIKKVNVARLPAKAPKK